MTILYIYIRLSRISLREKIYIRLRSIEKT
jgi:hypothetical protein